MYWVSDWVVAVIQVSSPSWWRSTRSLSSQHSIQLSPSADSTVTEMPEGDWPTKEVSQS